MEFKENNSITMNTVNSEVVILGAGVTGLAAGVELQDRAIILEKEDRPGGVVRSFCFDGYWFDNVVHLLHVRNQDTLSRLMSLFGKDVLQPCPPEGKIQISDRTVKYPFQLNLGTLEIYDRLRCMVDFYEVNMNTKRNYTSYKDFLLNTFGQTMCDMFFFPYNDKLWKYPLEDMTSEGQVWNIKRPTLEEVLDGAFSDYPNEPKKTYNSNGYYPSPPKDSPYRGMELLSRTLADNTCKTYLNHEVYSINPRLNEVRTNNGTFYYDQCLSTIPLPQLMNLCEGVPVWLKDRVAELKWNKVISIGLSVVGERPKNTGHWRYFTDPKVPFTKVIYMTKFDEYNAPEYGYGLLIEVPEPAEKMNVYELLIDIGMGLKKYGIIKNITQIIGSHMWEVNPAYVIFTKETPKIIEECKEFLAKYDIHTLGRYGNWEYSSMAENIEDGFNFGRRINEK